MLGGQVDVHHGDDQRRERVEDEPWQRQREAAAGGAVISRLHEPLPDPPSRPASTRQAQPDARRHHCQDCIGLHSHIVSLCMRSRRRHKAIASRNRNSCSLGFPRPTSASPSLKLCKISSVRACTASARDSWAAVGRYQRSESVSTVGPAPTGQGNPERCTRWHTQRDVKGHLICV